MRPSGAPGDERKIAVAPFRVGGAAPAVHYLREGLGDLMTPQLRDSSHRSMRWSSGAPVGASTPIFG
jgi:hypothetical protein